jgi:hypothetical protein
VPSTQNLSLKGIAYKTSGLPVEINPVTMRSIYKLRMHNVFHVSLLRPYIEEVPRSPQFQ